MPNITSTINHKIYLRFRLVLKGKPEASPCCLGFAEKLEVDFFPETTRMFFMSVEDRFMGAILPQTNIILFFNPH